ncbi:hypothetical protein E4U52_004132 [Claviceps spartinae]|nr:hypothetical protein E4U52_004132 [Claviceps spartinae]
MPHYPASSGQDKNAGLDDLRGTEAPPAPAAAAAGRNDGRRRTSDSINDKVEGNLYARVELHFAVQISPDGTDLNLCSGSQYDKELV